MLTGNPSPPEPHPDSTDFNETFRQTVEEFSFLLLLLITLGFSGFVLQHRPLTKSKIHFLFKHIDYYEITDEEETDI